MRGGSFKNQIQSRIKPSSHAVGGGWAVRLEYESGAFHIVARSVSGEQQCARFGTHRRQAGTRLLVTDVDGVATGLDNHIGAVV